MPRNEALSIVKEYYTDSFNKRFLQFENQQENLKNEIQDPLGLELTPMSYEYFLHQIAKKIDDK